MLEDSQNHETPQLSVREAASEPHGEAHRALTRGGLSLIATSVLTSILGVVYLLLAAHLLSRIELGRGSSLLSALWTVSALAQLNYAWALPGLLPRAQDGAERLLARAYMKIIVVGVALGLIVALAAPRVSSQFQYLQSIPLFVPLFAIAVAFYSIFCVEGPVLVTVRRSVIIPFEKGTYGLLKLLLLPGLIAVTVLPRSVVMLASWALPLILIIIPINLYIFIRGLPRAAFPVPDPLLGGSAWVRYDFLGYLFWLLGTLPLPVVVTLVLGPAMTASFYIPFTIATAIDVLSLNLGNTLTAEMSRAHGRFKLPTTLFVWRVWFVIGASSIGLLVLAPFVLDLFGAQYRESGAAVFRILMLACLPRSVLFLCIAATRARAAASRARDRGPLILVLQSMSSITTLAVGLIAMPFLGVLGMALGWLAASVVAATIAVITVRPALIRSLRAGGLTRYREPGTNPCDRP